MRWLLRTPRHHAEITRRPAPGNRIRYQPRRQLTLRSAEPGRDHVDEHRRQHDAGKDQDGGDERQDDEDCARHPVGLVLLAAREQAGVDRDEGGRQRSFTEQVLQQVGNAKRGVEGVCRIGLLAEIVGEDADPHEPGHPAEQDPGRNQRRGARGGEFIFGSGFGVQGSGCGFRVHGLLEGSGFRVPGSGFGFRVHGSGSRFPVGSGFAVHVRGFTVRVPRRPSCTPNPEP